MISYDEYRHKILLESEIEEEDGLPFNIITGVLFAAAGEGTGHSQWPTVINWLKQNPDKVHLVMPLLEKMIKNATNLKHQIQRMLNVSGSL